MSKDSCLSSFIYLIVGWISLLACVIHQKVFRLVDYVLKALIHPTLSLLCIILFLGGCSKNNNTQNLQGYVDVDYLYLAAPASGILEKLSVKRGQVVKAGQALFSLSQEPELSSYHQAQSNLAAAKHQLADLQKGARKPEIEAIIAEQEQVSADLDFSKKSLARMKNLFKKGFLGQEDLDEAVSSEEANVAKLHKLTADLTKAKLPARVDLIKAQTAAVAATQAQVKVADWWLQHKSVTAPTQGIVFDTFFHPGENVPANQAVAALISPEYTSVIFYVPEKSLNKIKYGDTIHYHCSSCQQEHSAQISYIAPNAEYTPPVIYSRDEDNKYVYQIKADILPQDFTQFHAGEPVSVRLG